MDGNLVSSHVLLLEKGWVGDGAGANHEESSLEVDGVEVFKQVASVKCRAIVVSETPSHLIRALDDIIGISASTAGPPAAAGVGDGSWVRRASAGDGCSDVGDGNAGCSDILDPLLNLGRVRRGSLVQGRVVGGTQCKR